MLARGRPDDARTRRSGRGRGGQWRFRSTEYFGLEGLADMHQSILEAVQACPEEIQRYLAERFRLESYMSDTLLIQLRHEYHEEDEAEYLEYPHRDGIREHACGLAFLRWASEQGHSVMAGHYFDGKRCESPLFPQARFDWEQGIDRLEGRELFAALFAPSYSVSLEQYKNEMARRERWRAELEAEPLPTSESKPAKRPEALRIVSSAPSRRLWA